MSVENGDILRVAGRLNIQGVGDFVNVFHFRYDGLTAADEDVVDWAASRLDEIFTQVNTHISNDALYVDVNTFNVTQDRPLGVVPWPVLSGGGNSAETLPHQVSAFVRFPTGLSRNWGKKFIGPFCESNTTSGGLVEGALVTALTNLAAKVLTPGAVAGVEDLAYVVHHATTNTWREPVSAVIRNVWATLRTRRLGRGG